MGTDSRKMARLMLPDVKLVSEPRKAARNNRMNLVIALKRLRPWLAVTDSGRMKKGDGGHPIRQQQLESKRRPA